MRAGRRNSVLCTRVSRTRQGSPPATGLTVSICLPLLPEALRVADNATTYGVDSPSTVGALILNSTLSHGGTAAVRVRSAATVTMTNTAIVGGVSNTGTLVANRCLYAGASGNNINGVPTFEDAGAGDYRLAPGSLGIDAADHDEYVAGCETVANIVYDNSTTILGFLMNDRDLERGDSVTLAGTDRSVVEISLLLHSNAGDVNADVRVRLYDGGDSGADPGALLWTSALFTQMAIADGVAQYDFAVPHILVGDQVTWTVELTNVSGDPALWVGPRFVAPPTIRTSSDYAWNHTGGTWALEVFAVGADNNNYGAIITTVCDSGTTCLGDLTGDGVIDLSDLALMLSAFATCAGDPAYNPDADLDGDGCVALSDLAIQLSVFATTCP